MKRREYIKTFILGTALPFTGIGSATDLLSAGFFNGPFKTSFASEWDKWPDMKWAGPQFWGNRLQDWKLENGKLVCDYTGPDRSLHLMTLQNAAPAGTTEIRCKVSLLNPGYRDRETGCLGLMIGAKGIFDDYRSASVFGKGLKIGLSPSGLLVAGDQSFDTGLPGLPDEFVISTKIFAGSSPAKLHIAILSPDGSETWFEQKDISVTKELLTGNFALLADCGLQKEQEGSPAAAFSGWEISGDELYSNEQQIYGPICFAQYTLHDSVLKLTAQCMPFEEVTGHRVLLQFRENGEWRTESESTLSHAGRAVHFRVENWRQAEDIPYRVLAEIPVGEAVHHYIYEGLVAAEPVDRDSLKVAVFSCNAHYGFPDNDIPEALARLDYDVCVFLGDQFYENTGGFGPQYTGEFDKTCLDYLRKWLMFGWSYRELFRRRPCAIIPDDHDVYHGNVWGEGGKQADVSSGYGSRAQDTGGYKMEPGWVNMVQFTQTSHLPDPVDPRPAKNNIGVYFTHWRYGGISFAILEDRKFKSAPSNVLPPEADVFNGWLHNKEFNIKAHTDINAELLGPRQEAFLEAWVNDWTGNTQMKAVLSQTNFATVATLPADAIDDSVVPSLDIPEKGEYVKGDMPTIDMDSNGWPVAMRNKALGIMRQAMAFHIAGDQHLATFIQYGIDEYGDAGFAFAGPALNNLWPRRFWPPVADIDSHSPEDPAYTGDHTDGFGNKFTLHAVANPYKGHREPAILHDRVNGYGLVTFNKKERTIRTECFRRFTDPLSAESQYEGWPQTIRQEDNYSVGENLSLPRIKVETSGNELPVLNVLDEEDKLVYAVRLADKNYNPLVRNEGKYRIVLKETDQLISHDLGMHPALPGNKEIIEVTL